MSALTFIFWCLSSLARRPNSIPVSAGISNLPSLEDADEPSVAVAAIHQKEAVAMDDIRLSVYGCGETVEGVDTDSLGMEKEEEPSASSSVCSSCSSPSESSHKTECPPSSVQVAVVASTSMNVLGAIWVPRGRFVWVAGGLACQSVPVVCDGVNLSRSLRGR